ncbi:hypothetical protein DYB37_001148 [Aphanomyces astaci]|uniref:Phospholipid/glycerol acyltransferase domain-containing protein n=1 Tax=Aphanomyces astaci TaxID=112090 RepID=A0A397E3Y7_APHAT|nr:hypothetical protein DYB36_005766 [Aphanomyces astaci]RHY72898.1 hypothetical protein DYB30_008109 [Aphanomyces astaci]RHY84578.1 hypothetical protein DYB26_007100 [Aphanomyces astaci]RHY96216.1 hypothetical protein DYB35_007324 [Aphanomyces astaci]RHZ31912.1 hypothetical protein DYB37_001148 [Aphanomyces astaci]
MEARLTELSIASRVTAVEEEVQAFMRSLDTLKKSTTLAQRNHERKKLYKTEEFIRLDIEDELLKLHEVPPTAPDAPVPSDELSQCKDPVVVGYATRLNALRALLTLEIQPSSHTILEKVYMFVRAATFALVMFGGFFVVCFLVPLRWIHLILRQFGVPNYYLPMDWIQTTFGLALCVASGIQISTNDRVNLTMETTKNDPTVVMFTEASKRSLKVLAKAVLEYGRSVAISPEGSRSKTGQLQDFKKGPFYLQSDVNKSITPAIVHGAFELWPPGRIFTLSGKAHVDYLPQFHVDPHKSRNANRLALRRVYLTALAKPVPGSSIHPSFFPILTKGRHVADLSTAPDTPHVLMHVWSIMCLWVVIPGAVAAICGAISRLSTVLGVSTTSGTAQLVASVMVGLETFMHFTC